MNELSFRTHNIKLGLLAALDTRVEPLLRL